MNYANDPKDYEVKKKRLDDVRALKQPDCVPVFVFNSGWGLAYSHTKVKDVLDKPQKLNEAFLAFCKDIYLDALAGTCIAAPLLVYDALKPDYPAYKITNDGYGFEHLQADEKHGGMLAEEYPLFNKDMRKYVLQTLAPRRYPALNEPYPKNYEALKKAYDYSMTYLTSLAIGSDVSKKLYGLPVVGDGQAFAPLDFLFDFLRGMVGIMTDIRRRPQDVSCACETIVKYEKAVQLANIKKGNLIMMPLHLAPYLNRKQFEQFYWPSFKQIVQYIIDKGAQVGVALEGNWAPYMEFLTEFPKGTFLAGPEYADFAEVKRKYGDKMAIMGGIQLNMLMYSTKQECCEYTKKLLDDCAPNGGFMASTDKALCYANDLNVENFKAVVKTIREYGRY